MARGSKRAARAPRRRPSAGGLPPFEELVREHGPAVLRVCRALLGAADAADAWSETFLAALRGYPRVRPGSDLRAWLATIAHHEAIDVLRRARRRRTDELPELPTPEGGVPSHELGDELGAALATLPPKQRGAVVHRYLSELSYEEVGALLGCSPVAARRNAADGIARLRRIYRALRGPALQKTALQKTGRKR